MKPYPWQTENWNKLQLANQAGRMTHAILLTGPVGIGLEHFSKCLTAGLLCENSGADAQACGDCRSCHLIKGESHPDLFNIEPEEPGKQIKVEEIRKLIDSIHLKSQYRRYKIAVIAPADAMNRSAANSLLKTLEEPPEHSLLILLSHRPNLLPITIRSRCQHMRFNPAYDEETVRWVNENLQAGENAEDLLKMAGGAPLAIEEMLESNVMEQQRIILDDLFALKRMQEDPIKVAEKWKTYETSRVLLWLTQLLADMVRIKSLAEPVRISDSMTLGRLQELIKQLELRELTGFYHLLLENYSMSTGTISYNAQGLLEDVIIFWQRLNNEVKR
ncbi:MAG: DNA polymerase III subunit delta' [Gammaproteobacteria bacterium]|nr:MAG: DNA polymerase III subunit delta' [Gammaproteobacteria bacterium]